MGQSPEEFGCTWNYGGLPPAMWSAHFPEAAGDRQSPIHLVSRDAEPRDMAIQPKYRSISYKPFLASGHIELEPNGSADPGGIEVMGVEHSLAQFHLHTPAEHPVDGELADLELHIVHDAHEGRKLVVAILFKVSNRSSPFLAALAKYLPGLASKTKPPKAPNIDLDKAFPTKKTGFYYGGSLTTPPCSEVVDFLLFSQSVRAKRDEIKAFSVYAPAGNNRPIQPKHSRPVYCF